MPTNVVRTSRVILTSIAIVEAFDGTRRLLGSNAALARNLEGLNRQVADSAENVKALVVAMPSPHFSPG